jgi:hypothetical protein
VMQNGTAIVRVAEPGDKAGIFALLKACADEIPVGLDGDEGVGRFAELIDRWCQNGPSFVAVADERIVRFRLTSPSLQPDERKLEYGGVASDYRLRGIFPRMLDEAKAISVRLDAIVKDANKSGMADRLKAFGFSDLGVTIIADEHAFRWIRLDLAPQHA